MTKVKEFILKIWNIIKNFFISLHKKIQSTFLFRVILKEQESKHQLSNGAALALQLVLSFVVEFIIEAFSRHSMASAFEFLSTSTQVFFYNSMMIFIWSLAAFLFRKRRLVRFVIFATWLILGASNGIILSNRVTPLTGPDINNVTEALGVVKKYFNDKQIIIGIAVVIILLLFIFIFIFRCPRYKGKMRYYITIPGILLAVFGFSKYTDYCLNHQILSSYFSNIAFAYQDYGFPYCFTVTLTDTGVDEPNNYSQLTIHSIVNKATDKVGKSTLDLNKKPNIIFVQLESFFDPSRVNYFETSEDPIPNWHALCEKYTNGFLTVPTVGAGTVNTEFEILTGLSMRFFGAGEYPYKGVLQDTVCESSAYVLKDLGYECFGLHNNEANFYSRKKVYKNLGFDKFISGEYMLNQNDVNENGWNRDRNLIQPILNCLDSTEGTDYIFTVSVQPHGAYPTEQTYEDPLIEVTGDNLADERKYAWEYYVNQLYEEDQFVMDLINAVNERKERTIIVFYGDHQPTMKLTDDELTDGTIYDTCYLIWDNMKLPKEDETLHSYQLFAKVMDKIGLHEGSVFKFQQSNFDNSNPEFLLQLQTLQYDLLYGDDYLSDYRKCVPNEFYMLGLYEPIIEEVEFVSDEIAIVKGQNFTQSSRVYVDGVKADTVFLNENQLFVIRAEYNEHSVLRIGTRSNSSTHKNLSYGPFYYLDPTDDPMTQLPEGCEDLEHCDLIEYNEDGSYKFTVCDEEGNNCQLKQWGNDGKCTVIEEEITEE